MADARQAYYEVGLATASPERLVTLLWDRLLNDLAGAQRALDEGALLDANAGLQHAQDILFELRSTLRVDLWPEGRPLADLYQFAEQQLVLANVRKDAALVETCIGLLAPLRDAFHEAARAALAERSVLVESR